MGQRPTSFLYEASTHPSTSAEATHARNHTHDDPTRSALLPLVALVLVALVAVRIVLDL